MGEGPMYDIIEDVLERPPFSSVRARHLFTMRLQLNPVSVVGDIGAGTRRLGLLTGGTVAGPRVKGSVLAGGVDWQTLRNDGSLILDVRLGFQCDNGAIVTMAYRGVRHGPVAIIERLEKSEEVDPASYYFRIAPMFETSNAEFAWLNHVVAVGVGHRFPGMPVYKVFEVL
jgi:Protein of unknown function (DUF3237)